MAVFQVHYRICLDRRYLIEASDEDEAVEQAEEKLEDEIGDDYDVRICDVNVVTKQEVEG